jgi:outer membrane protein OmpA-like peptidoglycan-associated protein
LLPVTAAAQHRDSTTIHFDFNRSGITAKAAAGLDKLLEEYGTAYMLKITLYGHCDFKGSDSYNDSLSQARIASVKKYLTGKGVPAVLFKEEMAYGERQPAKPGNTDEDRAFNRRVEMIVEIAATARVGFPANLTQQIKDSAVSSNLVLENLEFYGGRHILVPESEPILIDLVNALVNNPTVIIEIQGYVCCTAAGADGLDLETQTQDLSVRRAKAIYDQLIERGIDAKRLRYQGFGGSKKVFPGEENEYERGKNRRVEIKILSK